MEALPFIAALTNGQLPLESYVGQLRAIAVIQGTLEHESAQITSSEIRTLLLDRPSRLVHLRKDLSVFDPLFIPDIEAALDHTRKIAERIRCYRVEQPTDLLGVLYVLEGTTLGNSMHLPDILKTFGSQTSGTAHYYAGYGDRTDEYWQKFYSAMNALPMDQDGVKHLIQVALDFFDQLEALFSALYPIQNAKMVFTASMLNPEAGDHAVPGDVREIDAALAAAKKCRAEFPYFDERYEERGRSFAKSDAAWLASLVALPEAQLLSQVEWLGRVLGNRGMPRITLERQLELLHEELASAVPAKIDQYKGLLKAAESLKAERLQYITEPVFDGLAREFQIATDGELQGRFKNTGVLIVAAVCDQAAGVTDAVTSLLPWLTDVKRFSLQWTAAVQKTLEGARASVKRSQ
jgi:heme oxygenase